MTAKIGKYKLLKTLGEGWNSKVKLAEDEETGKRYACKIMFKDDAEGQEDFDLSLFLTLMNNEVSKLEKLPAHDNIIQLIEHNWKGVYTSAKGKEKEVLYVVIELAGGGDLFDYIFTVGKGFPEPIARYYFSKCLNAIEFLHQNNVVHRDLKLENLLLDSGFALKVADFGLSTTVESSYGGGVMYTRVGTERYMPPEMLEKNAYIGVYADLFALGVILFVLVLGIMPTHKKAESNDYLFKYIRKKDYDKYWTVISSIFKMDLTLYSESFFQLVTCMIKYDHKKRPTIAEIKEHEWMKGPIATEEEVRKELEDRRAVISRKLNKDKEEGDVELELHEGQFEKLQRGEEDDEPEDLEEMKERELGTYCAEFPRFTEFFSTYRPEVLMGALGNFCQDRCLKFKLSKTHYKAQVSMSSQNENIVDFAAKIEKVEGKDVYCLSFIKKNKAPQADFLEIYTQFREFCTDLNNAEL